MRTAADARREGRSLEIYRGFTLPQVRRPLEASSKKLAVLTIGGLITSWLLLAMTFALSAGDAFENPTWRAVLPELACNEDLFAPGDQHCGRTQMPCRTSSA